MFQGTPGTVTIDNTAGNISATGLQFAVNGYRIEGGPLTLFAPATIRVGDGTAAGVGYIATIASVIAGNDVGITKTDLGTLVLTGTNTFTVGTTINGGTVSVSRDANLGDPTAVVTFNGGALRVTAPMTTAREWRIAVGGGTFDAGANAFTHSGALIGSGTLRSIGSGTWTHSGDASAFAGRLELMAGQLNLSGRIGGTTVVGASAILSGTGTLGNLDLAGTLAPGNSPGALTATGDVTFRAGSTYLVELLANGMGDRINAGGRAVIEGGTVAITAADPARSYNNGALFRILNATGGRTGTFSGITGSSAFLDFSLIYDATGADVRVDVIRQFPDVALSFNQRQAATGLRDLDLTAGTDSAAAYRAILFLDADPARASFDATSGEIYASVMATGQRQGQALTGRMMARAHDSVAPGWRLFGGVVGDAGSVSTDGNGGRFAYDDIGSILGIDYRGADDRWAIGLGGGTSDGAVTLAARTSRARIDGWQVGGYVRLGASDAGANATFSIAHNEADARATRQISVADLFRASSGRADVRTTAYAADLRYGFVSDAVTYGPVATIEYQQTRLGRFSETGAASLNLSSNGSEENWTHYGVGGFIRLADTRGTIDAAARLVWGERDTVRANLVLDGAAGTPFQVQAAGGNELLGLYTLAGDYGLGGGWSIGGDLRATYGQSERSVAGSATVRLVF